MKKIIILVLFFNLCLFNLCFSQTSTSEIQRAQEMLEKEEALRKKLEVPEKAFVKKIVIEGVTLLSDEEITEITSPFIKRWLTEEDFQQIEELIIQAYEEKGFIEQPAEISHQIKKKSLIIKVVE